MTFTALSGEEVRSAAMMAPPPVRLPSRYTSHLSLNLGNRKWSFWGVRLIFSLMRVFGWKKNMSLNTTFLPEESSLPAEITIFSL